MYLVLELRVTHGNDHDGARADGRGHQKREEATETLAAKGLTVSDAVRVFLTRVVTDQQLPFALEAPNASTRATMREARLRSQPRFASAKALVDEQKKLPSRKRAVPQKSRDQSKA
jgi:DNA-damage-inducible protein J